LRNNYASVESSIKRGPVFLTKNGYGTIVAMTIEEYERLSDPLERLLDETDEYCRTHPEREDGEKMFARIRSRRHALRKVSA
jgi:PHD/YefM family antitoxin component YafN of YafNO toxin-antitoxin module